MANKFEKITRLYLFPLILFLFPLLNINTGVDLTDTGYSLANYVFLPSAENSFVLNTYLSNVVGYFLTKLPFGGMMLGMKFYTALFVSLMALLGYRFFITKMPAWIAFLSQMAAIGLCWCPTVIIYNYLTYLFFLIAAILLFRGLAGNHSYCLVLAGVFLGLNVFVRNPNIMEAALILCVWYYALIRGKKMRQVVRETLLCLSGYLGAVLVMSIIMMLHYGVSAPFEMISGLFHISASSSEYNFIQMLVMIAEAYFGGAKWLIYIVLCILPGFPFFMIKLSGFFGNRISEEKIIIAKKIIYSAAIIFLFYALSRIGMYNFKYYQKESALQWSIVFLLISLANMVWMLYAKSVDVHWKLIASIGIVIILITPLGSNNRLWPVINNLFFIAPVTIWRVYSLALYGRKYIGTESNMIPLFPVKAMQLSIIIIFIIQSLGVGSFYVFRDGEDGVARNSQIARNEILRGMRTTAENARSLQELNDFLLDFIEKYDLILYGDIPALSYYLNRPSVISNAWPDLDTFSTAQFKRELDGISHRPVIIVNARLSERKALADKKAYLDEFIDENDYQEIFRNAQFIVFL
ncbi:MAG: hypothetical protein FWG91_10860 [Lachnospiraceae bacterium]|nr:hypothetical protein [Lachnospiraceae bacterium]